MTKSQETLLQACYDLGEAQIQWENADVLGQSTIPAGAKISAAKSLIDELVWDYFQECNE